MAKGKLGLYLEEDFGEVSEKKPKEVKPEVKEEPKVVEQKVVEAPKEEVKEEMPEPKKEVESKPSEKTTATTKKRGAKRKMDEDLKADFLQIDIRGMRDYLSTITSYESMRTGDKVSFNTYIRSLIEKDMKKNQSTYENFKKLFEDK